MSNHEEPEPTASEAVARFGDEIRAAISAVADNVPIVAKSEAKDEARTTAVRWYMLTVGLSLILSVGASWLVAVYIPSHSSVRFSVQYGGVTAVCSRGPNAPDGVPLLVCAPG